ncbi:hypothetical protein L1887_06388 [Cichorium endivia]|nr:hypothetical protein L1887_06388 [Cichorium endivia]
MTHIFKIFMYLDIFTLHSPAPIRFHQEHSPAPANTTIFYQKIPETILPKDLSISVWHVEAAGGNDGDDDSNKSKSEINDEDEEEGSEDEDDD